VLVNLHTAVIGQRPRTKMTLLKSLPSEKPSMREVWFDGGWHETPVYQRERLPAKFEGPAIVEQLDCTSVLEPGNRAEVDPAGNLVVSV
jgi:N-methylhydantoinase A